ncbi:outer membrane beta-barrel protein [Agaribacterium sp. ZY112]|uniref:outer membrane beta-barrel protein n=1 Tax=Agaribacterium sp. ZY112 TaxID=3233574 RepID=UPI0035237C66
MKKISSILVASGLALAAANASAGKDTGLYAGASLASSSYEVAKEGGDIKDSDTSYKLFGGYNFGIIPLIDVAAEVSYIDFGSVKVVNDDLNSTGLVASGLAAFNMGPLGIFGKYGVAKFDGDVSDETNGAYGIGARIQLGSLAVRAEYEVFDMNDAVDVDYASIGASWTF